MAVGSGKLRKELVPIIVTALLLVLAIAMTVLQFTNLQDLREQVAEEEMALNEARALLSRRLQHRDNAPEYEERIVILQALIPDAPQEEQVLRYFDYLAREYDLNVQQISFGGRVENEEAGFTRMPLSITIEGRYQKLIDFLEHVYDGDRAVRVDNVGISLAESPEQRANIRISITASAFYSPN